MDDVREKSGGRCMGILTGSVILAGICFSIIDMGVINIWISYLES